MDVDPNVGSMIPEDLSTKCSIGTIIQTDLTAKFNSSEILDPIGSLDDFFGIGS